MRKSIKIAGLAVLCALAVNGPALARCIVDPADFASLRLSRSGLTSQREADELTESNQTLLCSTRALVRQIKMGKGHLTSEPGPFSIAFMSPEETHLVEGALTEWMAAAEKRQSQLTPGSAGPSGLPHWR